MKGVVKDMANKELSIVEFQNGKPFSVVTADGAVYDVSFSKDGSGYIHCSGGGPMPTTYYIYDGMQIWHNTDLKFSGNAVYTEMPVMIETLEDLMRHWDLVEADVKWCQICNDCYVSDDWCNHIYWHVGYGDMGGVGSVCTDYDLEWQIKNVLDGTEMLGIRELLVAGAPWKIWTFDTMLDQDLHFEIAGHDYGEQIENLWLDNPCVEAFFGWFYGLEGTQYVKRTMEYLEDGGRERKVARNNNAAL